jgi:O-acetyl-ADP-ribose deacetylase (regulator of RNase III)
MKDWFKFREELSILNEATKDVPVMVFGDSNASVVAKAEKLGLGEEWVRGDPMKARSLNAVVSPANTVGEMSGGYDLVIRNKLGMQVQERAMKSLEKSKLYLGQCRVIPSGNGRIPYLMIVPTVVGALRGGNTSAGTVQTKTPPEVIKKGAYNMMMEAHKRGINRFATVLLGGGVGGVPKEQALKLMLDGYLKAYDEIDDMIFGGDNK